MQSWEAVQEIVSFFGEAPIARLEQEVGLRAETLDEDVHLAPDHPGVQLS